MPGYAKFINDLVTMKRMVSFDPKDNMHHYSDISSQSLVDKKKDPRVFTNPSTVGSFNYEHYMIWG